MKVRSCKACSLPMSVQAEINHLRFETGMSLREICRRINQDYLGGNGAGLNASNLHSHFKHSDRNILPATDVTPTNPQNLPVLASGLPSAVSISTEDRASLYRWQLEVLNDMRKKFSRVQEKVDLLSDEGKGIAAYINLSREIRMAIEALSNLDDPSNLVGNISEKFLQKKSIQTQEFLSREFSLFRQRILRIIQPGREFDLDDSFRELVLRIQGFERENVEALRTDLRRDFGFPVV